MDGRKLDLSIRHFSRSAFQEKTPLPPPPPPHIPSLSTSVPRFITDLANNIYVQQFETLSLHLVSLIFNS